MGAWETGNFGNDDAMDFVGEVNDNGKAEILSAIQKISNAAESEYPEAPDCSVALAAIEYVAAAKGNFADDFPEEATEWLEQNQLLPFKSKGIFGTGAKEINIVALSKQAIDKIKTKLELRELWEEGEDYHKWLTIVENLKKRIS
jgi:hypothetical protein